jgi:mono/diheme cytochrome c family protein
MRTCLRCLGVLGVLMVLAAGGVYWFVSSRSFSAREQPLAFEAFIARNLRHLATPPGARAMTNPLTLSPVEMAAARDHFADHCALCHNNNGDGKTLINAGLYPPAPDLRESETQALSDGELFFIIKHGIRFTGMPGWAGEDNENWPLVAFIRHLPALSAEDLEAMEHINGLVTVPNKQGETHYHGEKP